MTLSKEKIPHDPWDERYIYLHEWLVLMVNVVYGKYTSPTDSFGNTTQFTKGSVNGTVLETHFFFARKIIFESLLNPFPKMGYGLVS